MLEKLTSNPNSQTARLVKAHLHVYGPGWVQLRVTIEGKTIVL